MPKVTQQVYDQDGNQSQMCLTSKRRPQTSLCRLGPLPCTAASQSLSRANRGRREERPPRRRAPATGEGRQVPGGGQGSRHVNLIDGKAQAQRGETGFGLGKNHPQHQPRPGLASSCRTEHLMLPTQNPSEDILTLRQRAPLERPQNSCVIYRLGQRHTMAQVREPSIC